jgi:hypothetical protein
MTTITRRRALQGGVAVAALGLAPNFAFGQANAPVKLRILGPPISM